MLGSRSVIAMLTWFAVAFAARAGAADTPVIRVIRDVPYLRNAGYPSGQDKLDLYLPEGRRNVPVLVVYHGGGLMHGDKREDAAIGLRFAAAGLATVIANYRLSPVVAHPAHVEDAAAAFAWVKRNIAGYGGNPHQMFAIGHSAGAYLVALLATDERYLAAHELSPRDMRGVVPVSAFYWVEEHGVAPSRDKSLWGTDATAWADASPANHVRKDVPPMLVLYADRDDEWRRRQNVAMVQALRDAGDAHVEIAQVAGRTHDSIWSKLSEPNDEAAERIIRFVRANMAARRTPQSTRRR
jgi:acetyl esterase/lipase